MITLKTNKFLAALTNLVVMTELVNTFTAADNLPLVAKLKHTDIESGDGIVFRASDALEVLDYNEDDTPFSLHKPKTSEQLMSVSDFKVIKLSLSEYFIKGAFESIDKTAYFLGYLRNTMRASKNIYLYKKLIKLIQDYVPKQATQTITINLKEVPTTGTTTEIEAIEKHNAKEIAKTINNLFNDFDAPTDAYNDIKYTEAINKEELDLYLNSQFKTAMSVDLLATAFNQGEITKESIFNRITTLPRKDLTDPNFVGYIAHNNKFVYGYFYQVVAEFFNGANLVTNDFMHFALYAGVVDALPAIKLVANYATTAEKV